MFEEMGLDLEDVETMATSVGLETEDLLQFDTHFIVGGTRPATSEKSGYSVATPLTPPGRDLSQVAKELPATIAAIGGKIDEIRDLLMHSSLIRPVLQHWRIVYGL
jgi:hypothetical protein